MSPSAGRDCTHGSITHHLFTIASPMLLSNLSQVGFYIVNAFWLGRFVGKTSIGAIAICAPIMLIFTAMMGGVITGMRIIISQSFGARDYMQVKRTIGASLLFAIILCSIITFIGILFGDEVLHLLNTPGSVTPIASNYLRISFYGFIIVSFGTLFISVLNALGDSKTSMYLMGIGIIINLILDPLLIIGPWLFPGWGLKGAAVANIIAYSVTIVLGYRYLSKRGDSFVVKWNDIKWNPEILNEVIKIGFPSAIQQSLFSLGMVTIAGFVNGFGEIAISGFGAARRIEMLSSYSAMSVGAAVSVIAGQNIGAEKYNRVQAIFKRGIIVTVAITAFFSILFLTIPKLILSIFVNEAAVVQVGANYLRIVGISIILSSIASVANGVINAAGHTRATLLFTLISLWGIRVPASWLLSSTSLGLNGIWFGCMLGYLALMVVSLYWYSTGCWKKTLALNGNNLELN